MTEFDLTGFRLVVKSVYLYYDGPRFFKAVDDNDLSYLVLMVEEDAEGEIYLIVRLDDDKIERMANGEVGVLETIKEGSEFYATNLIESWEKIEFSTLQEHQLPEPEVYFPNQKRKEELREHVKWLGQ